jgi:hypothetical protein
VDRVLLVLLGMALAYIAVDVATDGRLDGSLYRLIRAEFGQSPAR